jgi:hypothetical protein
MNWPGLIRFFIKKEGVILVIVLAIIGVCYYVGKDRQKTVKPPDRELGRVVQSATPDNAAPKENILQTRQLEPVNHTETRQQPLQNQLSIAPRKVTLAAFYEDVSVSAPSPSPTPAQVPKTWLPGSVLIPCSLVTTLESSAHLNTPVIGEVIRDVWQNGHLIIPFATTVSCVTQSNAVNDRVEVAGEWLFVFPDGKSLRVPAIACTRQWDPSTQQKGARDAVAGLIGENVESDKWANAKAFIALLMTSVNQTVTAGASQVLSRGYGGVVLPDTSSIQAKYLDQLMNGETGDGRFVRVSAGTQFYLFPTDTILPSHRAIVSTSRVSEGDEQTPLSPEAQSAEQMTRDLMKAGQPQQNATPSTKIRF